ncbi:hypothetical protein GUJ93_ZPchr0010g8522 [Zizania palustris]|uniref:Uncharacterized protein n=1 Tax=Zizania palustris TaxID=103762 RepID=A0A8J6BQG6_ZIZPA|nr:hypothetical protein GUJ93_ZPchr0010g8522 [Zizania palustris]
MAIGLSLTRYHTTTDGLSCHRTPASSCSCARRQPSDAAHAISFITSIQSNEKQDKKLRIIASTLEYPRTAEWTSDEQSIYQEMQLQQ